MSTTKQLHDDISAIKGYVVKHAPELINQFLNTLEFINDPDIRTIRNLRTKMDLNKMTVGAGVRPLNTSIENSKHKRVWTKRTIEPHYGMKIFDMIPEELRETFLSEKFGPNATELALAPWVWQQEFAKLGQEVNDNIYSAKYHDKPAEFDAATAYSVDDLFYYKDIIYKVLTATNAGETPESHAVKFKDVDNEVLFDGPGTIILKELAADNEFDAVVTGAYDETNAYDAYYEQWQNIPEAQKKNGGMVAYASHASVEQLIIHHNSKFGTGKGIGGTDIEEGQSFTLKQTNGRLRVKPVTWMNESKRIIMTKPGNLVFGTDQFSDMNTVGKMVDTLHGFKAISKFMLTFEFADLAVLHVNDQP